MTAKEILIKRLKTFGFEIQDKDDQFRVVNTENGCGVLIDASRFEARFETEAEKATEEIVYFIKETLSSGSRTVMLKGNEGKIFPVIRSTSFPEKDFVFTPHTAETRVYFAFDFGSGYHLISKDHLEAANLSNEDLFEISKNNLKSLHFNAKKQTVAGNDFYFINTNDGYDASRILLVDKLREYKATFTGDMMVSTPHQDVLIISDIRNAQGYDILAHMTMDFFVRGDVPITSLSLAFDGQKFKPVFILAKNRKSLLD